MNYPDPYTMQDIRSLLETSLQEELNPQAKLLIRMFMRIISGPVDTDTLCRIASALEQVHPPLAPMAEDILGILEVDED